MSEQNAQSVGTTLSGAVTDQTIFTCPTGYKAIVTMFFLSCTSGGPTTVDAKWHDGSVITFLGGKNVATGEQIIFGGSGQYLAMAEGDYITVSSSTGTVGVIVSYHLVRQDT